MPKKIISILGATGIQGGSVVDALLDNKAYQIRAITRNRASEAAQKLVKRGVEVVQADAGDVSSLITAFAGSAAIFAMTNFAEGYFATGSVDRAIQLEAEQGINLAKAAAATSSLEHYIWSTLPNSGAVTGGKITVPQFEGKNQVDGFIRADPALLAKTTFFILGFYQENFAYPMLAPVEVPGAGQSVQLLCTPGNTRILSLGRARKNIGLFAAAILAQPEKTLPARCVSGFVEEIRMEEMLRRWVEVHGKKAHYVNVDRKVFTELWTHAGIDMLASMLDFHRSMDVNPFSGGGEVLNKDDLGVVGLEGVKESFENLRVESA
ncbi:NmrA-like family protein-like protein [Aspergillus steynii IBT 23096]|uniref:NmrA-like family protein-like protein n=1 Tax=Aspergillus steynii IBT 23096 TaxID=1392250 RepID=A0A2I2GM89_9EURO|nr:NmrA-like family protein-like protein [Aspergillus steynii IBT 23096]PLB53998.1 NmrA-like family protein-like protein [Aspergillus steynii IBT 23096]